MSSGTNQADPVEAPGRVRDGAADLSPAHADAGPDGVVGIPTGRPRTATTTAEIDTTLIHPGSVKINVEGAFIVDQGSTSPGNGTGRGSPNHETKDIRLPNHTAVVSHVAIDVRLYNKPPSPLSCPWARVG